MSVIAKAPSPIERAMHGVELPYLTPPPERMAEAEELAAAYNRALDLPASPIRESPELGFAHRLLDEQAVAAFEALYPGGNVYSSEIERKRRAVSSRYRLVFDGSTVIWRVSRVAFTAEGSLAVIGLRSSGGGCWNESWIVLEGIRGSWHELPWGARMATCA